MADLKQLASDWPRISQYLDDALALDADARFAWLESLDEPEAVKARLRELLQGAQGIETNDFLGALPHVTVLPGDGSVNAGERASAGLLIGPYRLMESLGSGGMGEVWLAEREDGVPRRRIALKLPHMGWSSGLAERLARERDILASLEHPNIARLYDAGVDRLGRPYLALEYVDGVAIDRYVETHALSLNERLGLVLQVAAAVAHAHTKLVVHRDLKPSNILVTESGDVRLLDFGIAKLLQDGSGDATELTRQEGRALTPDYASPEQIRGEAIGTASDVYSLGVVAFELATGVRPYALKGVAATSLADAIARVDVPLASRVAADAVVRRQLAGDLDAIFNKALKKGAGERYATVAEFAADINRHLAHLPVLARPDRLGYRTRQFVRRYTLQVVAGGLVLLAVLAGSGVALWQARTARIEAARAEQVKDFALSILQGTNTDSGAGANTTALDVLKAARTRVDTELGDKPETAVELMTSIGDGFVGMGANDAAVDVLAKAVARADRELGATHPLALAAKVVYASALVNTDHNVEAKAVLVPVTPEARRQKLGHVLVDSLRWRSSAEYGVSNIEGAVAAAREGVEALSIPGLRDLRPLDRLTAWASLANALNFSQQAGMADAAHHAMDYAKQIYGDKSTESTLAVRELYAKGLAAEDQDAAAIRELRATRTDMIAFSGANHSQVAVVNNFLGQVQLEAGDPIGALDSFRQQLAVSEHQPVGDGLSLGLGHSAIARAYTDAHDWAHAADEFTVCIDYLRKGGAANERFALRALSTRAMVLAKAGKLDESERAFAALEKATFQGPERAAHAGHVAVLRNLQGRHDEAIALAREALEGTKANNSKIVRAVALATLGRNLLAAGHAEEALAPLTESDKLYTAKQLTMSPDHLELQATLGEAKAKATQNATVDAQPNAPAQPAASTPR